MGKTYMDVSRYCGMEELKLNLEFVTPCFLGGADSKRAELRASSFKGMIRYWWRVLYGAKYGNKILEKENEIFGSASDETSHASNVRIEVSNISENACEITGFPKGKKIDVTHNGRKRQINILDYLAYGKYEYVKGPGNQYTASHIKAGTKFSLKIACKKEYAEEIFNAVYALIEYGGIGSRCRNGFGSMRFIESSRKDISEKIQNIKMLDSNSPSGFSAFSCKTKSFRTKENKFSFWEEALSEIGIVYKKARESLEAKHNFDKRGLLARPIVVKNENIPKEIKEGRHPKPVFIHINKNDENKYEGKLLLLPISFYEKTKATDYSTVIQKFAANIASNSNVTETTGELQGGSK